MSTLRKPTETQRFTIKQEAMCVLDAEEIGDQTGGLKRRVTLLVPVPDAQAEPPIGAVFMAIDIPTPDDIALTRTYHMVPVVGGFPIRFYLQPEQKLYLMVASAMAVVGAIIEYLEDPKS